MDCSAPTGKGLNKTINKADFPCKFDTVRDVVKVVARTGERSYLAKRDWDGAYRQARVRPKDIRLLGFRFKGWIYYDVALPFGLTSSSAAHNWFAELFESILLREINGLLAKHFADDHIFDLGVLDDVATERLRRVDVVAEQLGVAFSLPKSVGPVWILKFVGFVLATDRMEVRIPCAGVLEGVAGVRSPAVREADSSRGTAACGRKCKLLRAGDPSRSEVHRENPGVVAISECQATEAGEGESVACVSRPCMGEERRALVAAIRPGLRRARNDRGRCGLQMCCAHSVRLVRLCLRRLSVDGVDPHRVVGERHLSRNECWLDESELCHPGNADRSDGGAGVGSALGRSHGAAAQRQQSNCGCCSCYESPRSAVGGGVQDPVRRQRRSSKYRWRSCTSRGT